MRVLITGSSTGLGLMVGRLLVDQGHSVVLHARNRGRAAEARAYLPEAEGVLVGDVSTVAAMRDVAGQANATGRFDAVVHNVGLGFSEPRRVATEDGLSRLWAVNVLAPYVLTALIEPPDRLVYLSSGMHLGAEPSLEDVQWTERRWNGTQAYSDTKLHDVWLAFGVGRRRLEAAANVVSPGWVATRMGGAGATDALDLAHRTQAWLAVGDHPAAHWSGGFYKHEAPAQLHPAARNTDLQDRLLAYCAALSGLELV